MCKMCEIKTQAVYNQGSYSRIVPFWSFLDQKADQASKVSQNTYRRPSLYSHRIGGGVGAWEGAMFSHTIHKRRENFLKIYIYVYVLLLIVLQISCTLPFTPSSQPLPTHPQVFITLWQCPWAMHISTLVYLFSSPQLHINVCPSVPCPHALGLIFLVNSEERTLRGLGRSPRLLST